MNLALEKGERVTTGSKGRGETGGKAGEITSDLSGQNILLQAELSK